MGAHTTSDDPSRYRLAQELDEWKLKDPIARVKSYLTRNSLANEEFFAGIEKEAEAVASKLRSDIIDAEDPYVEAIFDYVYAEPHPILDAEKSAYINYLESFTEGEKK